MASKQCLEGQHQPFYKGGEEDAPLICSAHPFWVHPVKHNPPSATKLPQTWDSPHFHLPLPAVSAEPRRFLEA